MNKINNHLSYKMEGAKSTNVKSTGNYNNDDYYKNVKLVGFVKTDSETLSSGYKNEAFQWSSSDNLSTSYATPYRRENNILPSKCIIITNFFVVESGVVMWYRPV